MNRGHARCAAFVVQWLETFEIVAPVVRALRSDGWRVAVVVTPERDILHGASGDDVERVVKTWESLNGQGFAPEPLVPAEGEAARLRELGPVAVFLPSPYDGHRHESLAPAHLGLPVHYVNYGFNINLSQGSNAFELPFYRACHSIYAENEYCAERYARAGVERSRIIKTGSPALDHWDAEHRRAEVPTILWCPYWSASYSTFISSHEAFLEEAAGRPQMSFIIRPHPYLWAELRHKGLWTRRAEQRFHARTAELENVTVEGSVTTTTRYPLYPSHIEQFEQAWAMVTDGISFLAEFAYTGKPVLLTQAFGNPGWNAVGNAIVDLVHRSDGVRGLTSFLDEVERDADRDADTRREVMRRSFYRPPGGSAAAIASHLAEVAG